MVLRAWRLPEEMVRASCAAEQWFRPAESPYGMTEILQLAHWHDPEHHVPWAEPLPDDDAPVLRALPLDAFTASGRLLVVREAGNELEKLRAILHA
jgi:HD-like signal output (HDOD) protein